MMTAIRCMAPVREEDEHGVTIAVAILLRVQQPPPDRRDPRAAASSPYMDSSRMSSVVALREFPSDRVRSYIRPICGGVHPPGQDGHSRTAGQSWCRLHEPGLLST